MFWDLDLATHPLKGLDSKDHMTQGYEGSSGSSIGVSSKNDLMVFQPVTVLCHLFSLQK